MDNRLRMLTGSFPYFGHDAIDNKNMGYYIRQTKEKIKSKFVLTVSGKQK